ncbi:MAG: ATP-binding protein [Acidimicrobiales bacterium]
MIALALASCWETAWWIPPTWTLWCSPFPGVEFPSATKWLEPSAHRSTSSWSASSADNSVRRVLEGILKADLILIDEIGFAPMHHTGAQLFFRLVAAAYERRSLGVASHWPFEDWGRFLPDHSTAVSLLDRLLHHNVLVVTEGESYRMKEARQGRKT